MRWLVCVWFWSCGLELKAKSVWIPRLYVSRLVVLGHWPLAIGLWALGFGLWAFGLGLRGEGCGFGALGFSGSNGEHLYEKYLKFE